MRKLVNNLDSALSGIELLNRELPNYPELADRLGQAHAFYVLERDGREPMFGVFEIRWVRFAAAAGISPSLQKA